MKKNWMCTVIGVLAFFVASTVWGEAGKPIEKKGPEPKVKEDDCYSCHADIKEFKTGGKHGKVNCSTCHNDLAGHLADPSQKPMTLTSPELCGSCHKDQFESFITLNYKRPARLEKSLLTERSPNPYWDKLMAGHGFTKEHNAPRSHVNMVIDHLVVDRAYGGRYQPKKGWSYVVENKAALKAWDVLEDKFPDQKEHKPYLLESAAAANPTCMQCKTQDQILKWKYMGDKDPNAKWDRTSNPPEFVKDLSSPMNCFYCHDPHAAKPRIVRDGLIQALTRPEKDTLWHKDEKATKIDVKDFRNGFRKIALLEKYDTKLQCGQCHVEYNCNPGYKPEDGSKIGTDDPRTNHFPFKDVFQIYDHYKTLGFRDFKHALTEGLLWKAQHPEAETFWNSVHDKVGASCQSCHMPKVKNKQGKVFTSHWQTSPRAYLKETCGVCHKDRTEADFIYEIDSIRSHIKGKMRKAEFWLSNLIDKIVEAKKNGLPEQVIKDAQDQHAKAHILWEWWTAENSDGFHNPDLAKRSLTQSVDESKKGIELVKKALAEKAGGGAKPEEKKPEEKK